MKSFLFTAIFAVLYFYVPAQTDNKIVIGKVDSVYSNILGEKRKVWSISSREYLPETPIQANRYPCSLFIGWRLAFSINGWSDTAIK
jgi:hypothetical protein